MKLTKTIFLACIVRLIPLVLFAQEQEDDADKKKGTLERFGDDYEEEDEPEGSFWIFSIIDPVDIAEAIAHRRAGPFPYNGISNNFKPSSAFPSGTMHLEGSYFNQSSQLYGVFWKYSYYYDRFGFETDFFTFYEDTGDETDRLDIGSARVNWDVLGTPEFRFGLQAGLSSVIDSGGRVGPAIGARMIGLPLRPIIFEAAGAAAYINANPLSTFSATIGIMLWRFEFRIGGHLFQSTDTTIDGWKFGLRLWL